MNQNKKGDITLKFTSVLKKTIIVSLLFVILSATWISEIRTFAEGPLDPAPQIEARGTVNGKSVLFDNTHGQTAGAADWVIDGAFSDFANALADEGYFVKELRKDSPVTYDDIKNYHVFIIPEANIPFKTSEQDALIQYVQNGGSIFFIADHYNADRNKNRWDSSEVFNGYRRGAWADPTSGMTTEEINSFAMQGVQSSDWLANNFGVRFRYNAIGDVIADNIVAPDQAFGITQGVQTVAMHAGSTLAILDPNKSKGIVYLPPTNQSWPYAVDQGVYNGGGVDEGPYVAISKLGLGKAAFIGDSSPVEDSTPKYLREENGQSKTTYDGFLEQDDATLLVNIVNWLAIQENYTSFDQVAGLTLDQPTNLLSMETPANSTEPQPEPWAAPDPGYDWWDRTTFKQGSYGPDNQAPTVVNPIDDQSVELTCSLIINVSSTFSDADNNSLTLSAVSGHSGIATVSLTNQMLTVTPVAEGTAAITVTADDGIGGVTDDVFNVTVNPSSGSCTSTGGTSTDLFFSEYVEGSSYNKALEIYNGTGSTVDLSAYTIELSNTSTPISLSGTLASGDVFVIANPGATAVILNVADMQSYNIVFNGDDSVTLKHNGTVVDVIGTAGTTFAQDTTLVRRSTVTDGATSYDSTEWDSYPKDTFDYLGSHTGSAPSGGTSTDLFFTEYIEGSSYNKALEIYNGIGSTVDLSAYTIELSNTSTPISLSGTLASGDVFVIANPGATAVILNVADMQSYNIVFNGDDSVTLKHNGTVVDVIGTAGTTFAQDTTLVRRSTVTDGATSYDSTEWDSYPKDTFDYLGSY